MFSRFFIDRPIFATVLSIVITLAGGVAVFTLPHRAVSADHAADRHRSSAPTPAPTPEIVAETVAAPIEQQVNGVENMMYMSSQCTNDGSYSLTVTFKHGVDLNMAQVLVQNRVNLALPQLPDVVKQTGVTTRKRNARHPPDRQPQLARRPLRPALPEQLRLHPRHGRAGARATASATSSCSASATTACASGSTPTSWRPAT